MNQSNHHQAELPGVLIKATSKPKEKAQRENLVILPTYNEAINLQLLVPSILRRGPFDVLIVDDNSLDGTGEVAESLAKRFPGRVDVLHRPGKLGLGTAYLAGFHYALRWATSGSLLWTQTSRMNPATCRPCKRLWMMPMWCSAPATCLEGAQCAGR